jgi:Sec-independent protein translocase protein TatA
MGRNTKRFKQYLEDLEEDFRPRDIKKESRHNKKKHLKDIIEHEDWDELEDELQEQSRIHRR